jgi:hypothetical protein
MIMFFEGGLLRGTPVLGKEPNAITCFVPYGCQRAQIMQCLNE